MDETQSDATNEELPAPDEPRGRWCLVANLGKEHAQAARPKNSRHLPSGAKVYVKKYMPSWDYERAEILIKDRRSYQWRIAIAGKHWLENFRAVLEYSPSLQKGLMKNVVLAATMTKTPLRVVRKRTKETNWPPILR